MNATVPWGRFARPHASSIKEWAQVTERKRMKGLRWNACGLAACLLLVCAGCGGGSPEAVEADGVSVYDAAAQGNMEKVGAFLRRGGDVNAPDDYGMALLHYAAAGNQVQIVEMLMEDFGADPQVKDAEGNTALDLARKMGANDAVRYLSGEM